MTIDLHGAHAHSARHRAEIEASDRCGCFCCGAVFPASEILDWVDGGQTALCPRCGIDSVLGDASGLWVTDPAFLTAMNRHWF